MGDRIVVEAADLRGARLVVHIGHNWDYEYSLTPQHVADFIVNALRAGWRPLERGPQFEAVSHSPGGLSRDVASFKEGLARVIELSRVHPLFNCVATFHEVRLTPFSRRVDD